MFINIEEDNISCALKKGAGSSTPEVWAVYSDFLPESTVWEEGTTE